MTFQDIQNFSEIKKYKPHKVAFGIPGMIGGLSFKLLDGIESIRQALGEPVIELYIFTWKDTENMKWVNKLESIRRKYPYIRIYIELEDIHSSGYIEGVGGLLDNLGIKYLGKATIDKYNNKRLISLYVQYRLYCLMKKHLYNYPFLEEDNKTLIVKVNTNLIPLDNPGKIFTKVLNTTFHTLLKHICTVEIKQITHPYDIIYTTAAGTNAISDKLYLSSLDTLINIFGNDDSDFWSKMLDLYTHYLGKYRHKVSKPKDFEIFGKDLEVLPLEGSVLIKHLINISKKPVQYYASPDLVMWTKTYRHIANPWPEIVVGKWQYGKTETFEFLKNIKDIDKADYIL